MSEKHSPELTSRTAIFEPHPPDDPIGFLLGENALEGSWWGDTWLTLPCFWWRTPLREQRAEYQRRIAELEAEVAALKLDRHRCRQALELIEHMARESWKVKQA